MEVKIIFEIEEGSKPIIENLSKALMVLGNTATIQNAAGTIVGKITNFSSTGNEEDEYVKQEMKNWQTNDVKTEVKKATKKEEKPESAQESSTEQVIEKTEESPKEEELPTIPTSNSTYTLAEVQLAASTFARSSETAAQQIKDVLKATFGVARISEIEENRLVEFANALISLGAKL